jgi:hypothetical protein
MAFENKPNAPSDDYWPVKVIKSVSGTIRKTVKKPKRTTVR